MTMLVSEGSVRARHVLRALVTLIGLAALAGTAQPDARQTPAFSDEPFIVKPYLQLGDLPKLAPTEAVRVLWQSTNEPGRDVDGRRPAARRRPVAAGDRDRRPAHRSGRDGRIVCSTWR